MWHSSSTLKNRKNDLKNKLSKVFFCALFFQSSIILRKTSIHLRTIQNTLKLVPGDTLSTGNHPFQNAALIARKKQKTHTLETLPFYHANGGEGCPKSKSYQTVTRTKKIKRHKSKKGISLASSSTLTGGEIICLYLIKKRHI